MVAVDPWEKPKRPESSSTLSYPPQPTKKKNDILFLVLFSIVLGGWVALGLVATFLSDPSRYVVVDREHSSILTCSRIGTAVDSFGNICGVENVNGVNLKGRNTLFFYPIPPNSDDFVSICVASCPTVFQNFSSPAFQTNPNVALIQPYCLYNFTATAQNYLFAISNGSCSDILWPSDLGIAVKTLCLIFLMDCAYMRISSV